MSWARSSKAFSSDSSASSPPETLQNITTWMLARDPPVYQWQQNLLKAMKTVAISGDLEILKSMRLSLRQLNWWFDIDGYGKGQLIHLITMHGHLEMVKWMESQGCFPLPPHSSDRTQTQKASSSLTESKEHARSTNSTSANIAHLGEQRLEQGGLFEAPKPHSLLWFSASHGHLHILLWILQTFGERFPLQQGEREEIMKESVKNGHFNVFVWLLDSSETSVFQNGEKLLELTACAISSGSIKMVELLETRATSKIWKILKRKNFRYWSWALDSLAINDRVEMLDLLVSQGWVLRRNSVLDGAVEASIRNGALKSFSWFDAHYLAYFKDPSFQTSTLLAAISYASMEFVGFLIGAYNLSSHLKTQHPRLLVYTAKNPHLEVARFLKIKGCYVGTSEEREQMLLDAAMAGHLEFLKWLFRTPLPPQARLTGSSESSDKTGTLKEAKEGSKDPSTAETTQMEFDELFQLAVIFHTASQAPISSCLNIIQWLHQEQGFPINRPPPIGHEPLLFISVKRGDFELMRWLIDTKGLDPDEKLNGETLLEVASRYYRDEALDWLKCRQRKKVDFPP